MRDLAANGAVYPAIAMLAAVALMLLCGGLVHSDVTQRRIPNAYCAAIAGLAIVWWIGGEGWAGLIGLAKHLYIPLLATIPLLVLFALRIMAGGDVKLMLALLLWVPADGVAAMMIVTVLAGGLLAVILTALRRVFSFVRADSVPYGVPIVAGALLILLPQFRIVF